MDLIEVYNLRSRIIACAFEVAKNLRPGFLEIVYGNALAIELSTNGIKYEREKPIEVYYKGYCVGDYKADFIVENCYILELKAVASIQKEHEVQLVNYLTATGIDEGMILNFGEYPFKFRTKFRDYQPRQNRPKD